MVEKTGDGKGTDAADYRGDSSEVGAFMNLGREIAFDNTLFAGSASIYKNGAGFDHRINNQPRNARGSDDYIILVKLCQVGVAMKEGDVVIGGGEHFVKWGADEFAAPDESDFLIFEIDIVAGEEPVNGSGGGGVEFGILPEAVDVFLGGDEVTELFGLRFVGEGELEDNGVNAGVVVCANDFFSERV